MTAPRPRPKFGEVLYHRLKYFLSPQLDLYKNVKQEFGGCGTSVLDYGCGTGIGAVILRDPGGACEGNTVLGVDCDGDAIQFAHDLFGALVDFQRGDWSREEVPAVGPFGLITCIEVIEHVEEPANLLWALASRLRDDGVLVISTLNHNSQYRKNDAHVYGYHVSDFVDLLRPFFQHVVTTDYMLRERIGPDSTVTPVVAICRKR